jgi:hypothetical protein
MVVSSAEENRLAVVIVVDGLRASALGAYGNTTFPTPLFDELASRSLIVEWLLAKAPTLESFYQDAISGVALPNRNYRLFTDDRLLGQRLKDHCFREMFVTEPAVARRAKEIGMTHAAVFFSQAIEQLAVWINEATEQRSHELVVFHFSGLTGAWDAPLAMRDTLLDEDDPPAPTFVTPPRDLRNVTDPDELLGYRVAYAAQVSVVESCLAGFFDAFETLPYQGEKLVMVCGSRGFALGEHGCVGHGCQLLYSEQLQLPWLIVADENRGPLPRVSGFAQPVDLGATLTHWLSGGNTENAGGRSLVPFLASPTGYLRDAVVAASMAGESLIRTPAWLMIQGEVTELYAKPDDRWEANDVASRCSEIVEQLRKHLTAMLAGVAEPLAEELVSPWR